MDAGGNFRHNDEVARFHSKAQGKPHPGEEHAEGGDHVEIHSHGDGTFHTVHKGEEVQHETHGHALMHAAKMHAEEGHKHFHAHHDGATMHTHAMHEGGEPEHQEHDPENLESLKDHFNQFIGEEEKEPSEDDSGAMAGKGVDGMY